MPILLKREDIAECEDCKADALGVEFTGHNNADTGTGICSHFESEDGWWLRIDHKRNSVYGDPDKDIIGALKCPSCVAIENERMKEFFDFS